MNTIVSGVHIMEQNIVDSVKIALLGSNTNKLEYKIKEFIFKLNEQFKNFNLIICIFGLKTNEFNTFVIKCCNQFGIKYKLIEYTNQFNISYNIKLGYKFILSKETEYIVFFEPLDTVLKGMQEKCNKENITYKIYVK